MSLEEKLDSFFNQHFLLKKPSEPTHLKHIYADYIELIAILNNGSFVSIADIIDRFYDEGINIIEHYKSEIETENLYFKQKYDAEIGSEKSIEDDLCFSYVTELFELMKDRSLLYGSKYPFQIENDKIETKSKLDDYHFLYVTTLLCSSLNTFNKFNHTLTSEFEDISAKSLKEYLGENAVVKQIGENSVYSGNAKERIKALANDMLVDLNEKNLNKIPDTNLKERGVDVAAWFPFKDCYSNMLVMLFQCACGKGWITKQDEVKRYDKYLQFNFINPICGMFIPYAVITDDLEVHQSDDVLMNGLLFDRNRIMAYYDNLQFFTKMDSYKIAEAIVNYSEDIV